jgi:homoserine dehydrogenase
MEVIMKKVKIALLGLGTVGKGIFNILKTNNEEITKRAGYDIEIAKILVRDKNKNRDIDVDENIITTNFEEVLYDESIDIIVEVIGGLQPAYEYVISALKNKKHVVTANKLLIASKGDELISIANEEGVSLYYEASVAGGIPIIHSIKESLTANKIEEIIGIMNGTTNYILSKMTEEGLSYETALKEAQAKGYAEADPTSDVGGYDALYKLRILTSLAFGCSVDIDKIYREGIESIKPIDIDYAKEFGFTIKLLSMVKEKSGALEMRVHPTMIPSTHPLANVNDSFNAIFVKGNAVGELMYYGRGAGELPTGSAVVGDIISILRNGLNNSIIAKKEDDCSNIEVSSMEKTKSEYYIRLSVKDEPGVLSKVSTILGENDVSIFSVIQKGKSKEFVPLVFVTHKTYEGNIKKSIDSIKKLPVVNKIESLIRVENLK